MSNIVLVKNSTYYSSSLNEGYAMANVKNTSLFDMSDDILFSTLEEVVDRKELILIKQNITEGLIVNGLEKDPLTDPSIFNLNYKVCMINDLRDKIYYNLPIITLNINYGGIALNIPNKEEDNILDANIICAIVRDEYSNQERVGDIFFIKEFTIERPADVSIFEEGSSRCMVMNNSPVIYEDIEFDNISNIVFEKETRDINCVTEQSVVIFLEDQQDGFVNQPMIEMDVSNKTIDAGGSGSGLNTGGDLDALIFTIQQMSFFEFTLVFKEKKVKDIFNLPQGLFFDKDGQRIIGTPMLSGRYPFTLTFDNDSTLSGIINVPKLNREL